ncbi:MAG: hypothetical protein IIY87_04440 [Bacteroidales bacterium]|jgi:hypothetical protein|nr:hypothetical protein [Bacteroidales bacterium]
MKKITLIAILALLFATGCNKTKECKCESVQKFDDPTLETIVGYSSLKLYKGYCQDRNVSARLVDDVYGPYTVTINCVEL